MACLFTASTVRFPSCHEENGPDPKSGRDLDPDKPVCAKSCREDITDPAFSRALFCSFHPQ